MIAKPLLPLLLLGLFAGAPDEGQWLPQQFLQLDWDALKARGLELTKDEFWHPENGGVLSAAVQINGCSASLVSPRGLVITNHHCVFGAIQRASSVDRNYVEDGFVALAPEQEIPARGVQLRIVRRIEDVTDRIHAAEAGAATALERLEAVEAAIRELEAEGNASAPYTECRVSSYLEGRIYTMAYRTLIQDVRLVYAPPRSVGEFGGDIDNWEWPRHTGDFSFLRAYVGPDGKPAPYSRDNVPLEPDHYLRISSRGLAEGDLVMIMGYPGRTSRYLSSVAVEAQQHQFYPLRQRYFAELIRLLELRAGDDPELKLQLSSNIKSFANVEKNARGMVLGLARNGVFARKQQEEAEFGAWLDSVKDEHPDFQSILDEVLQIDRGEAASLSRDTILTQFMGNARLLSALMDLDAFHRAGEEEGRRRRVLANGVSNAGLTSNVDWLEKPLLAMLLRELLDLPEGQRIAALPDVLGNMAPSEFAELAYSNSAMLDASARRAAANGDEEAWRADEDPLVRLASVLGPVRDAARSATRMRQAHRHVEMRRWIAAQQAWRGTSFYPDANSTLRVSVASVRGYSPRDGVFNLPFTRLGGVLAKETGQEPFTSPKALFEASERIRESRFFDERLGDIPVCFLADGDTTGGNSGSGVINGRGELVGLNFDRVFENVAGDFGWNADRSRNISVDIRYVLWHLEQVVPAPALLEELGF